MSALEPDHDGWPPAELLFPPRRPELLPGPRRDEADPGALRPVAPEPSPSAASPWRSAPAKPVRKRSVVRGVAATLQFVLVVVFTAALAAAVLAGGLLLLTMVLRAAAT